MASKYNPLSDYLRSKPRGEFTLTFKQIEEVLGFALPKSAERPHWWANTTGGQHPQTQAWQTTGFDAFLVAGSRKVRFKSHRH